MTAEKIRERNKEEYREEDHSTDEREKNKEGEVEKENNELEEVIEKRENVEEKKRTDVEIGEETIEEIASKAKSWLEEKYGEKEEEKTIIMAKEWLEKKYGEKKELDEKMLKEDIQTEEEEVKEDKKEQYGHEDSQKEENNNENQLDEEIQQEKESKTQKEGKIKAEKGDEEDPEEPQGVQIHTQIVTTNEVQREKYVKEENEGEKEDNKEQEKPEASLDQRKKEKVEDPEEPQGVQINIQSATSNEIQQEKDKDQPKMEKEEKGGLEGQKDDIKQIKENKLEKNIEELEREGKEDKKQQNDAKKDKNVHTLEKHQTPIEKKSKIEEKSVIGEIKKVALTKLEGKDRDYETFRIKIRTELELRKRFKNSASGGYFTVTIHNLNNDKILQDIAKKSKKHNMLAFTQAQYHLLSYKKGDRIRYEFQEFFSNESKGVLNKIENIPNRFSTHDKYFFAVTPSHHVRKLLGMEGSEFVKWKVNDKVRVDRVHSRGQIIFPKSVFKEEKPKTFYDEISILNPKATWEEYLEQSQEQSRIFREENLLEFEEIIGERLEGRADKTKPKLVKYIIKTISEENIESSLNDLKIENTTEYEKVNEKIFPGKTQKPDAYSGPEELPNIVEIKAKERNSDFYKAEIDQIKRYHETGHNVILVTSLNCDRINKQVKSKTYKILADDDMKEILGKSQKKDLLLRMWKLVGDQWPHWVSKKEI